MLHNVERGIGSTFCCLNVRVDMKVRNRRQEIILIELQYEREFDYLQRILFATAKTINEHLPEGEPYEQSPSTSCISTWGKVRTMSIMGRSGSMGFITTTSYD